jgi:hypothetical protein
MRGGGGQKMSVFVHAGGGGVKKWQNSVHVVVECPLREINGKENYKTFDFGYIWIS